MRRRRKEEVAGKELEAGWWWVEDRSEVSTDLLADAVMVSPANRFILP